MTKTRILTVDDEHSIIKYLRANLEANGYEVIAALNGPEALQTFEMELPDLVLLDVRMPEMDGFEVCRRIREWSQIPIIMLTAVDSVEDKVKALDLGADDYVTKPFGKNELIARVKAVLRRTTPLDKNHESALHFHNLVIDLAGNKVTLNEQDVNMTATEYRLLSYLARNAGLVVTPGQILKAVWGEEYSSEHDILRIAISRLRKKLGDDPGNPRFIATRIDIGYVFLKHG